MKETDMSRTARAGGRDRRLGPRPARGRDMADLHPRRLMPARAHGRSLMHVRALLARAGAGAVVLLVVQSNREEGLEEHIRKISARKATPRERKIYAESR